MNFFSKIKMLRMETLLTSDSEEFQDATSVPYPTDELYNYEPLDRIVGAGITTQRNIFGARLCDCKDLTSFEMNQLTLFEIQLKKDEDMFSEIDPEDTRKLRFLQGCGWNFDLARNSLRDFLVWKNSRTNTTEFDPTQFYPMVYWYGRDKCYRPVLVIRCDEIPGMLQKMHTSTNVLSDIILDTMDFFVDKLAVPDHVEQLVVIADLKGFSLWDIPISEIQIIVYKLSSYFRSRLHKVFLINSPLLFYGIWTAIKGFIPERTAAKFHILDSKYIDYLLEHIEDGELCPFIGDPTPYA